VPQDLVKNTVAIFEVVPSEVTCESLFFYVRKNQLDTVTDIEMIGENAIVPEKIAVDLIYPYQFDTEKDLETKVVEIATSIFALLNQQVEESKQMSLFDVTEYSLN
tara:strand:- start:621 stop:938 length:318 start_codon:yes stop_codon:yes gene_type:complete